MSPKTIRQVIETPIMPSNKRKYHLGVFDFSRNSAAKLMINRKIQTRIKSADMRLATKSLKYQSMLKTRARHNRISVIGNFFGKIELFILIPQCVDLR